MGANPNGYFAPLDASTKRISHPRTKLIVHTWRAHEDAIGVGYRTALHDDPLLTVRLVSGASPLRIILDPKGQLPPHLKLFHTSTPTQRYVTGPTQHPMDVRVEASNYLENVLSALHAQKVLSLLIEGGAATLQYFLQKNLWDELRILTAAHTWEHGLPAPTPPPSACLRQEHMICQDKLSLYTNPSSHSLA